MFPSYLIADLPPNARKSLDRVYVNIRKYLAFSFYELYVFLKFASWPHYLAAAAQAPELEIHPYTQYLPALAAAGMLLFHCEYVAYSDIHGLPPIIKKLLDKIWT
jgi:hypothetical protein